MERFRQLEIATFELDVERSKQFLSLFFEIVDFKIWIIIIGLGQ